MAGGCGYGPLVVKEVSVTLVGALVVLAGCLVVVGVVVMDSKKSRARYEIKIFKLMLIGDFCSTSSSKMMLPNE